LTIAVCNYGAANLIATAAISWAKGEETDERGNDDDDNDEQIGGSDTARLNQDCRIDCITMRGRAKYRWWM